MKFSKYNIFFDNGDSTILLFNTRTLKLIVLVKEIYELIDMYIPNIESLDTIHHSLYLALKKYQFILKDEVDEQVQAINTLEKRNNSTSSFEFIINPTLDCNLRCWYCYEEHLKGSCMSASILKATQKAIVEKLQSKKLKTLQLSFFGGEPLMKFNSIVYPLIEFAKNKCEQYNKKLKVNFTSNGVLLTPKNVDKLFNIGVKCFFQIAFDGDEQKHDQVKKHPNGHGSYQETITNIKYAISRGIHILVRCNYTADNIYSFQQLIKDFSTITYRDKKRLHFDLKKVWQVEENETTQNGVAELYKLMIKYRFVKEAPIISSDINTCYADKENSVVINYDGNIFKCTAQDFKPEASEGFLNENGEIHYNQKYEQRMRSRYSNARCLNCKAFPICTVCSQRRMFDKTDKCLLDFTDEDIENFIYEVMVSVSRNKIQQS